MTVHRLKSGKRVSLTDTWEKRLEDGQDIIAHHVQNAKLYSSHGKWQDQKNTLASSLRMNEEPGENSASIEKRGLVVPTLHRMQEK